jgi:hypothetical protein
MGDSIVVSCLHGKILFSVGTSFPSLQLIFRYIRNKHLILDRFVLFSSIMNGIIDKISKRLYHYSTAAKNHPTDQCILWTGARQVSRRQKNDVYGVMSVKWPGMRKSKTEYVHRVSYILVNLRKFHDFHPKLNISHLCHNNLCINPSHLSHEPGPVNKKRQICVNTNSCTSHDNYPKCMLHLRIRP